MLDEPATAAVALDPLRARILTELGTPGSASTVAATLGLPRQRVNYHLRVLEQHGLIEAVEARPRRGLVERVVQATAAAYVLAPPTLGRDAGDVGQVDRLSARYLIAVAARLVREVAALARRADAAGQSLPTLALDAEIRFGSPSARADFTHELAVAVQELAARYHDETTPDGRWFRLLVAAHPRPADRSTP